MPMPPTNSMMPPTAPNRMPGCRPSESKYWPVPVSPYPPRTPKILPAPCRRYCPTTNTGSTFSSLIRQPSGVRTALMRASP